MSLEFPTHALHHTYIVVGERTQALGEVKEYLHDAFHIQQNYPDISIKEFDSMGVDDVQTIVDVHMRKPLKGNKKFIIVCSTQITQQAQNSLLKMLEEPSPDTHFFIIMPTVAVLLPTILSRAHVVHSHAVVEDSTQSGGSVSTAGVFLKATVPERFEIVADMLTQYDKEKIKREDIIQFINAVEKTVHEFYIKNTSKDLLKDKEKAYETLLKAQEFVRDPSSSLKLILEYLALRVPRT